MLNDNFLQHVMAPNTSQLWGRNRTILLHKDKHMIKARESSKQPRQLDLFQMLVNDNYSNSVELYQSLPDLFCWKQDKLRNNDWTLPVLSRHGIYNKNTFYLDISPANISTINPETKKKTKKAFYKTIVADFIEHALHKLSISGGFFLNDKQSDSRDFGLITTYYQVREELKRMWKTYSYDQIKDGISILAGLRYELSGDISTAYGIDSFFSPIDLTIKNDRANPQHSELYITFNKLISKKIMSLEWRGFNYTELMKIKSSFWRTLFMRLSHRFQQADAIRGYHFLLSTLVVEGTMQDDLITSNVKKINQALGECSYIIDHYTTDEKYQQNPKTKRRILIDYKITVYPTESFQKEQYRLNTHHKSLRWHKVTSSGQTIVKPMLDQFDGKYAYGEYLNEKEFFESIPEEKTAKN